jgi:hypothetical protein
MIIDFTSHLVILLITHDQSLLVFVLLAIKFKIV